MSVDKVRTRRSRGDGGFTLIELMVTIVIAGILFGIVAMGYKAYAATQAQRGTAEALVVLMREAQQRAVTEGTAYGVKLSPAEGPWVLLTAPSADCTGGTAVSSEVPSRSSVKVTDPTFTSSCVIFKPRGTATEGTAEVTRDGSSKVYTIEVEGLTGRASVS